MDDLLNSDVVAGIFQGGLFHGYVSFDRLLWFEFRTSFELGCLGVRLRA
jgi:hypothetical protein